MDIEVRHLRYFVAVAEEGSFTAAARRVHVTQQVLSTQIQQLETILGVQLLERSSRGASVTAAGASFLDGARSTLAELDRAASAARNSARAIGGVLPVGLSVAAGGELADAGSSRRSSVRNPGSRSGCTASSSPIRRAACWTAAPTWPSSARLSVRPASSSPPWPRNPGCGCCLLATRSPAGTACS